MKRSFGIIEGGGDEPIVYSGDIKRFAQGIQPPHLNISDDGFSYFGVSGFPSPTAVTVSMGSDSMDEDTPMNMVCQSNDHLVNVSDHYRAHQEWANNQVWHQQYMAAVERGVIGCDEVFGL